MGLRALPEASELVGRSVFLTGAMRTGTTMMAQLFGSLKGVEMFIEPPFSYLLLPMIRELPPEKWRLLFEFILYEDYLIPALAGRNLNRNPNDLTYIGNLKPEAEINARLTTTHGHLELVHRSREVTLAFKMPEMLPYVSQLRSTLPDLTIVTMLRNPESAITSTLVKRWYSDEGLRGESNKWPLKEEPSLNLPFWLPDSGHDDWSAMNELERCAYAYLFQYRSVTPEQFDWVIDYDEFVRDPSARLDAILEFLGLQKGDKTPVILSGIREPDKQRQVDWDTVDRKLRDAVFTTYESWRGHTTKTQ